MNICCVYKKIKGSVLEVVRKSDRILKVKVILEYKIIIIFSANALLRVGCEKSQKEEFFGKKWIRSKAHRESRIL